jgi:hypothetical protein
MQHLALTASQFETDSPRPGAMLGLGQLIVVVLLLAVSPLALFMFGWQYFDTGGSPIEKFHPATLIAGALLVVVAAQWGNPIAGLLALMQRHRALVPYIVANGFMLVYVSSIHKLPVTIFIETFLGAALVFIVFYDIEARWGVVLARIVHLLMFANCALGLYEVASGWHLTPLVVNGELLDEPRATALLGHPLANAALVGLYVLLLACGGGRDLPRGVRAVCFLVAFASLFAFGGRAATGAVILCLFGLGFARLFAVLGGARFDQRSVVLALVGIPAAIGVVLVANELGLFATLTDRLFDDEGSAGTRIEMFELFKYLSAYDFFFGPDPSALQTWVRLHGLEYGIESFVVAFVLNYGLIALLVFFPPLFLFLWYVAMSVRPGGVLATGYFFAVCLTSISLSSKSPSLSIFVLLVLVLLRPDDELAEFSE